VSAFYSGLSADSISAVPGLDFSHRLFNGASFDLAHPAEEHDGITTKIASLATVKSIWPVRQYSRPEFKSTVFPASDASNALKRRDDPSATSDDTYPVHAMGGVDKVRDQGYTGSGLFVAIVDTGVDYKHPALGGGFGAGFKIAHGYDFAGDAYNGTNTAVPKADPYSQCNPHGTHVSGIVGANANEYNFTGVVPDATLGMYKVFGCAGTVGNDLLIAAFLKAQQDGADVITASIGGASGWEEGGSNASFFQHGKH
jgi:subtilisin family serine protease